MFLLLPTKWLRYGTSYYQFCIQLSKSDDLRISLLEVHLHWKAKTPIDVLHCCTPLSLLSVENFRYRLTSVLQDAQYTHILAKAKRSAEWSVNFAVPSYKVDEKKRSPVRYIEMHTAVFSPNRSSQPIESGLLYVYGDKKQCSPCKVARSHSISPCCTCAVYKALLHLTRRNTPADA